jgi:hypothetical protein
MVPHWLCDCCGAAEMTIYWFTYLIGFLYLCNAAWLLWHGDWQFAGYWLSALSITVFSFLLASR